MYSRRCLLVGFFTILCLTGSGQSAFSKTKSKIAILDLRDKGVGPDVASLLTGVISTRLAEIGIFTVITRDDIKNILTHEQDKILLGCADESCLTDIGGILGAEYLIAGEVGMVGQKYVIGLQRIDVKATKVVKRVDRQFEGSREKLLQEVANAAYKVIEDILQARSGMALLNVSEEGADILVDGKTVGSSPMKNLPLAAGPRDIRISKNGFVDWVRTIQVQPQQVQMLDVTMIPSAVFIQAYEDDAKSMRMWAWITLGTFVAMEAGAVALRTYTYLEYDPIEDDYANGEYRGMTSDEFFAKYKDDMDRAEIMDYAALAMGIAGIGVGVLSLYLFLEGDDPNRYEKFRGFKDDSPKVSLNPVTGGGTVSLQFGF
ncbi:MAG: PEGA domain-containing protein [Deltaproteobacteria bacterium]|nr:PEGA domain-containing protein [Deltaproteobacteria bacterium]